MVRDSMRDIIEVIHDHPAFSEKVAAFQLMYRKSLEQSFGSKLETASTRERLLGLCQTVRQLLMGSWIETQNTYAKDNKKQLYYLSMEYLLGRLVKNALTNMNLHEVCRQALEECAINFDDLLELELDPGLGNGGLGRLAACFLDSMATMNLPVYAYGIRFEFGMFRQIIDQQQQKELPDAWLRFGNPFEVEKSCEAYYVAFGGTSRFHENAEGHTYAEWSEQQRVLAVPHDLPIPGYGTKNVNTLRLWAANADEEFHFAAFNAGDYVGAVMDKVESEVLTKVLYPNDSNERGKHLRLKQQYFLVAASLQDILKRFKSTGAPLHKLSEQIVIQLNDTHPTLAIPELLRLLIDEEGLDWDQAWALTRETIAFTNHTVMPEALECWSGQMFRSMLPRHYQIIEEINRRFVRSLRDRLIYDQGFIDRVSILGKAQDGEVRMANLAVVTCFSVNGVAELHTCLLKQQIFPDFYLLFPQKFNNKTNGISPRRWLNQANPQLSSLISEQIGSAWITDLNQLRGLESRSEDFGFLDKMQAIKRQNKVKLAAVIQQQVGERVDPDSLFDVQIKRIHEYKRQLLKLLQCVHQYHYIRDNYRAEHQPRTVIFAGKAAPGYHMAKLCIQLIHAVAACINRDPLTNDRLKLIFLPNYNVSMAERIIPAADLSEQISTAGTEASGTGNMKFCLNGALILGTLDGANIEIKDRVGLDNIFIFGHSVDELRSLHAESYDPRQLYAENLSLRLVLDKIVRGFFSRQDRELFRPIWDSLMTWGDHYYHLADFQSYVDKNREVDLVYRQTRTWQKKALLNIARIGWFSSDRTVLEYSRDIWRIDASPLSS